MQLAIVEDDDKVRQQLQTYVLQYFQGRENDVEIRLFADGDEILEDYAADYDLILIDCAPSLDQLTINGLTAAGSIVVVTHSKLFSANGLAQLLDTIDSVRQHYNPTLTVAGVIVNQHEEQTVSGRTWLDELHTAAASRGLTVLSPPIPKRVVISDALEAANGLDEWGSAEATALGAIYADHLTAIEGVSS